MASAVCGCESDDSDAGVSIDNKPRGGSQPHLTPNSSLGLLPDTSEAASLASGARRAHGHHKGACCSVKPALETEEAAEPATEDVPACCRV
jgi:hypothetical protein